MEDLRLKNDSDRPLYRIEAIDSKQKKQWEVAKVIGSFYVSYLQGLKSRIRFKSLRKKDDQYADHILLLDKHIKRMEVFLSQGFHIVEL